MLVYPPDAQGTPPYLPFAGYPPQSPGYPPYPGYPSYQGYTSPLPGYNPQAAPPYGAMYNGYPPYAYHYPWQPPRPKRDGYLFAVAISSLVGSFLVFVAGIGCLGLLGLLAVVPHPTVSQGQYFASIMLLASLAFAGIVGGWIALYHRIHSAFLQKPS